MSAAAARSFPASTLPGPVRHPKRADDSRHIEIVTTRSQRLARPRLVYSLVIIAGLFAVLATQLLLSIALADGAYQISELQGEQKELSRAQLSVTEKLNVLESPQNLAARAESLGLVSNSGAVYLNLATGDVLGSPQAAKAGDGSVVGKNGSLLVPNALLVDVPSSMTPVAPVNGSIAESAGSTGSQNAAGAPERQIGSGSVASTTTGIPGPTTR